MAKIRDVFPRVSTLGALSDKLVRHFGLPNGSKFGLRRKAKGARPFVRSDVEVRRKFFRRAEHPRDPTTRVSEMCKNVETILAPSSRLTVVAFGPDGAVLDGNTSLRRWQAMQGQPTQAERDAKEERRQLVDGLRRLAIMTLGELEEAIEDPNSDVTEAVMSALVDRYGADSVRGAFKELRL